MGLLDSCILSDNAAFDDPDAFAEPVVYTDSTGAQYSFNCLISRGALTPVNDNDGGASRRPLEAPQTTVSIPFDPAGKVGLPAKPQKNETITFPLDVGTAPSPHLVVALLTQDAARWKVRVR